MAIWDFAGGAAVQAVSESHLRRYAGINVIVVAEMYFLKDSLRIRVFPNSWPPPVSDYHTP